MVNDSVGFGALLVGVAIGLVIMIYGVTLTAGQSVNAPTIVGGAISLGAVFLMTLRIFRLETPAH